MIIFVIIYCLFIYFWAPPPSNKKNRKNEINVYKKRSCACARARARVYDIYLLYVIILSFYIADLTRTWIFFARSAREILLLIRLSEIEIDRFNSLLERGGWRWWTIKNCEISICQLWLFGDLSWLFLLKIDLNINKSDVF